MSGNNNQQQNQQNSGKGGNQNQAKGNGVSVSGSFDAANIGKVGIGNYFVGSAANAIGFLAATAASYFSYQLLMGIKNRLFGKEDTKSSANVDDKNLPAQPAVNTASKKEGVSNADTPKESD